MKKYTSIFLLKLLLITIGCSSNKSFLNRNNESAVAIKVASYNIRNASDKDINAWGNRKKPVADLIIKLDIDIIGVQEPYDNQIPDLDNLLEGYSSVTAPYATRSFLAIYYKKNYFEVLDSGMFWLSETPDEPSEGWDSDEKRICHWAKFKDKASTREFYYFNTHFYWRYQTARKNSGPLVAKRIRKIAGNAPVIFVGDLNSQPETSQIESLKASLNDAFDVTQTPRKGPENTNLGGGVFQGQPHNRIDYIFVSKDIKVLDYTTHEDLYKDKNGDNRYPSDHLPISANIILEQE